MSDVDDFLDQDTSEVAQYFRDQTSSARLGLVGVQDADPEQAARAVELSDATGVPSTAIFGDLDGFERANKAQLGGAIVAGNQYIADYLNSHPMAPRISHDDLGQLDIASGRIADLFGDTRLSRWLKSDSIARSFMEGFGAAPIGSSILSRPSDVEFALSHPLIGAVGMAAATPLEFMSRSISGMVHMGHDGLSQIFGESFANEAAGMAEWALTRGDIAAKGASGPLEIMQQNAKVVDGMRSVARGLQLADPWTRLGQEPPVGIHPLIDEAKKLQAKEDIDALDDALKESQKSATRDRAPDFYANFVRAHLGEREIGIDSEAIRALYGDKVSQVDDNLLGWVPDLDKKLAAAELTGDDVRIPVADWLAKVDPEVAKALHDDIRVRDNGMTINETKVEAEPKEAGSDIVQQLRAEGGFEPMLMAGDRFIRLQKLDPGEVKPGYENFHDFDILDENDNRVGTINLSKQGKRLYVEMIQAGSKENKFYQPNYLGPSLIRDIKRQLKNHFPDVEEITGHRVSGAREKAGSWEGPGAMPVVKLNEAPDGWQFVEPMRKLLQGYWEPVGQKYEVLRGETTLEQQALSEAIRKELERITPAKVGEVQTPLAIRKAGEEAGGTPLGFYQKFHNDFPTIIAALDSEPYNAVGIARHEAIHHLRAYGFFTDREWATLERAARDGNWVQRYLGNRYNNLDMPKKLEEAVAEGYRKWVEGERAKPEVHALFERLKQFIEAVKTRFKELAGKDLNWEEIFRKVDEGEIGSREGTQARTEAAGTPFDVKEMTDEREAPKAANDMDAFAGNRAPTYDAAAKKQQIERLVKDDTERGDHEYWRKIATDEGHLGITNKPNPLVAARAHSRGGKTTLIIGAEGKRTVFNDGIKAVSERFRDLAPENFEPSEMAVDEPTGSESAFGIYDRGKALGVTQAHMDRMLKLIERRNAEDLDAANRRAELRQRRRSNKEYKERRTILRDEVRQDLSQRPDLATDALFARQKIKLHPAYLSEDQRARLPKDYIQQKDGVNPDDLAPYFGYTSGDALVERLGILTEDRRRAGMSQRDYLNRLIDVETDRRLNQEFGNREQNILDEAKDQALSETQLNLVHEETMAFALKAGQEPQFTQEQVREAVRGVFNQLPVGQVSSDKLIQTAGKIGKKIEEAGAKGDWETAYRLSQQRNHAMIMAKLARGYEKSRAGFDRTAKTFRKREVPSVAAEYTNWIHDILLRVGRPVNRSVQDLSENIARKPENTLKDFVEAKEAEWMGMRELPVADYLLDPNFRSTVSDLTVDQFMGLKQSVDALVKAGRDEKKIYRQGEAMDREQALDEMRGKLETFGYKPTNVEPGKLRKWPRAFWYGLTNMETLLNRWDRADPRGIFNRLIAYPLADAANAKASLQREVAAAYKKLPKADDLDKLVDSPFPDPMTRTATNPEGDPHWTGFNRGNILMILQNMGNKSNAKVLAHGYGSDVPTVMSWLARNITKDDVLRAQALGDSIFKPLIEKADKVYERMTGSTVEKIPLEPVTFKTRDGDVTVPGWYHPLVADAQRKTVWVQDPDTGLWSQHAQGKRDTIADADFFHFSTANGYTKRRTGAIYPLDLNYNLVPTRVKQMIHDISFKEVIHETQKIFSDARFREDVAKYYGAEYADGLMPYLRAVAGAEGIPSRQLSEATGLSEFLRQNVISTYIGFNPFTVMKHGPTAAVMSSREVGPGSFFKSFAKTLPSDVPFLEAVRTLFGQSPSVAKMTHDFILKNSEEIQRRERHWQDTIAGQGREITGAGNLREKVIEAGSAAVAWSDMVSAKPTWLAAYDKSRAAGLSHGESISLADRAVRRAHGSTAETNQPPLVRGGGPLHSWLTSVYGFFGTAMQRRIETAHKLNDAWELGKARQINAASRKLGSAFADFMTYMVWPTIVEEAVTGIGSDDHRTWGSRLISGATMGAASSVLYLRDLVHGAVSGHEPGVGMLSSALHDVNNLIRDASRGRGALSKQHAGKTVGDLLTVAGEASGMVPKIVGNAARYGINVASGQEKPKSVADVLLGASKGTQKRKVEK